MPFEKFKAKHGGQGPFEAFYDAATDGEGLFGRKGLADERTLTDQLIAQVQNDEQLAGLVPLAEQGQAPLTRQEHAEFRSGLMQQVLNQKLLDANYADFTGQQARLRNTTTTADDDLVLDGLDSQLETANRMVRSGDPAVRQEGAGLMAALRASQREFATTNELQNIQLAQADKDGRNEIRKEIQGLVNQQFVAPILQDTAQYSSIAKQLERGEDDAVAAPALTTMVLDYAGASLRQSDDGNWGFSFGGLSIGDKAVPDMTYSQLRNQLNDARQGRDQYLRGQLDKIGADAQKQGFGIDGAEVSDLRFALADAVYKTREQESAPPPVTEEAAADAGAAAATTVGNTLAGFMRGTGATGAATNFLEHLLIAPTKGIPEPPLAQSPETFNGLPINRRGQSRGVYVPGRLRTPRLPTND